MSDEMGESKESDDRFPAERLRVYGIAEEFQERIQGWLPRLRRISPDLAEHLERATNSIVLNLAEGGTEFSPAEKRRFYRIALRSGGEAGAALRFFMRRVPQLREEMRMLSAMMGMITGLCKRKRPPPPSQDP